MLQVMIAESSQRFDKMYMVDENLDNLLANIDYISNSNERIFVFKKNKDNNLYDMVLDLEPNKINDGNEIIIYSNPAIISVQQYELGEKEKAIEKLQFFIGVEQTDGLKYSIYNTNKDNLLKDQIINVLNNVNNTSQQPLSFFNKVYLWLKHPVRIFKVKCIDLLSQEVEQISL